MNLDLATNIRPSDRPMIMSTNDGMRKLTVNTDVEGIEVAKYDPQQIANILGFSHMANKFHVTYDSEVENAFFVYTEHKVIKFAQEGRLYCYTPSKKYLNKVAEAKGLSEDPEQEYSNVIASVQENKMGYTDCQFEQAKQARWLYH